jgi:hypothetical protein
MRRYLKVLCYVLAVVILTAAAMHVSFAYTEDRTASVGASGDVLLTPGSLLDDFRKGVGSNVWGGTTYTISSAGSPPPADAICSVSYVTNPAIVYGRGGKSLQLTYNVTLSGSYAGYLSNLSGVDLSSYNYLTFWVKGATGGEFFKITLSNNSADNNRNKASIYITDYLQGGVTTTWQKVTIPFDAFYNITDRTSMKDIQFIFEQYNAYVNGSPTSGIVYIDNIAFGKQFLGYVKVNPFSYRGAYVSSNNYIMPLNSTGGQSNYTQSSGMTSSAYTNALTYNTSPYSMRFYYSGLNVATDRWAAAYFVLGGGNDGWQEMPRNLSNYSKITFWAKGETSYVKGIKVELTNSTGTYYNYFKPATGYITTTWSKKSIDFANIKSADSNGTPSGTAIDPSTIKKCSFVESYWLYYWTYTSATGAAYIDNIQFESASYAADTTAPAVPAPTSLYGSQMTRTVITTASSSATDASMECVRFEYYNGTSWVAFGYDYDTSDADYSVVWDLRGLSGTLDVRAVAVDAAGNEAASGNIAFPVPNMTPTAVSVTPSNGSSLPDTYAPISAVYDDMNGYQNMEYMYLLVNTSSVSYVNCLYARYIASSNLLYLMDDAGSSWLGGFAPGSANVIENSYCRLDCATTTVSGSWTSLTITWNVSFKSSFFGSKNVYLKAIDTLNANSGWQVKGLWRVLDVVAPQAPTHPVVSGAGSVKTVSTTASSQASDPTMSHVRFEYFDGVTWHVIGTDTNTSDTSYSVTWDQTGLTGGPFNVRAIAVDASGNETPSVDGFPAMTPITNKTVTSGSTLSFTISATDPDGDRIWYHVYPGGDVNHSMAVTAADCLIITNIINSGQNLNKGDPGWNASADVDNSGTITAADALIVTNLLNAGKTMLPFNPSNVLNADTGGFVWSNAGPAGTYSVLIVVTDGQKEDAYTFSITVN